MQYHALSCAKSGLPVDLLGYTATPPLPALTSHPLVHVHPLVSLPSISSSSSSAVSRVTRLILAPMKVLLQVCQLLYVMLFTCPTPDFILVQNPPSIPSLACCAVVALLRSSSLIIDWHNFGYSLISLSLGRTHRLTALHRWYEHLFSHSASAHLCVTRGMQAFLLKEWGVRATVLYDRPPREFEALDVEGKHEVWVKLEEGGWVDVEAIEKKWWGKRLEDGTILTRVDPVRGVVMREDRPMVAISSTSWTADEDFTLLLEAVKQYETVREGEVKEKGRQGKWREAVDDEKGEGGDVAGEDEEEEKVSDEDVNASPEALLQAVAHLRRRRRRLHQTLPPLLILITGKGPLLSAFLSLTSSLHLHHVHIATLFLPFSLYPPLLGSADFGLSFHTSSSGLDLPMKVVDMFGAGLPVLAVHFPCLSELVKEGETGYSFRDGGELGGLMEVLVGGDEGRMGRMRENVHKWASIRWEQSWGEAAAPLFLTRPPTPPLWSSLLSTATTQTATLLSTIPSRVRFLLLFMTVAVIFRVTSYPIPALPPPPSLSSLTSLSFPVVLASLTSFAQSPAASLIVLSVIAGVTFWLFVVYRVNRAVGDETGAKGPRGIIRGPVREPYTSSEEDKEE